MSASNGNGSSDPAEVYRRHHESVERYRREAEAAGQSADQLRAEAERLAALAQDWENRRVSYETRARQAGAAEADLQRSKMTARQKSDYITAYGRKDYEALPWDDGKPRDDAGRFRSPNWR